MKPQYAERSDKYLKYAKYVSRLDIYLEGGYYLIMDQNDFLGSATII